MTARAHISLRPPSNFIFFQLLYWRKCWRCFQHPVLKWGTTLVLRMLEEDMEGFLREKSKNLNKSFSKHSISSENILMSPNLYFSLEKAAWEPFACVYRETMGTEQLLPAPWGLFPSQPPNHPPKLGTPHVPACRALLVQLAVLALKGQVTGWAKSPNCACSPTDCSLGRKCLMGLLPRAHPWNHHWKTPAGAKLSCPHQLKTQQEG